VAEDHVATYAWYSLAAASGKKDARLVRDIYIKDDLEPSKIVRGQEMAKEIWEQIEKRKAAETHYE